MNWNVAAVMTTDVVTVGPDTVYKEVVERLHDRRVSAAPVVDAEFRVLGVVSEADLLLKEERRDSRPGSSLLRPHGDAARAQALYAAALMNLTRRDRGTRRDAHRGRPLDAPEAREAPTGRRRGRAAGRDREPG